jgi:hypothetical protein
MRVMTVRQHIAEGICEFLPEMVVLSIQRANMEHRRQHLERITQLGEAENVVEAELIQEPTTDSDASME